MKNTFSHLIILCEYSRISRKDAGGTPGAQLAMQRNAAPR